MGLAGSSKYPAKFLSVLQPIELTGIAPRQQYNIYPFASVAQDSLDDETRYQVGADVFWRPSSNFQLNATLNPDFGNVESDDAVVNLSATETFFKKSVCSSLRDKKFLSRPLAQTPAAAGSATPVYPRPW